MLDKSLRRVCLGEADLLVVYQVRHYAVGLDFNRRLVSMGGAR